MALKIKIINPISSYGWDNLITSNHHYSFFHSRSWAEVICRSYDYKPCYFLFSDRDKPVGLIPMIEIKSILTGKRGVSLPFTDCCDPIFSDQKYFAESLNKIIAFGEKSGWKYIEIKGGKNLFKNTQQASYFYGHTLTLDMNVDKLLSGFRSSTRRNIKKAAREGVECKISSSFKAVQEFYRLNCITRKMHGLPAQPFSFFKHIYDYVINKANGIVVLAVYRNRIISGSLFFHFRDSAVYKYGASDKAFQFLRANNAVMWSAIKFYAQNGYRLFDMGISEPNNSGLIQFKNGWGGRKHEVNYYRYNFREKGFTSDSSDTYSNMHSDIRSCYRKVFSKMPIFVLKVAGLLAYRHIG